MQKQRNTTLNILEFLACFAVVTLHCNFPGVIGKIIYGDARFAVPVFFMVSGYFIYSEDIKKVILKLPNKIKHILVIYLTIELFYFLWYFVKNLIEYSGVEEFRVWLSQIVTEKSIVEFFIFQKTFFASTAWFLISLILCYIVTYPIAKYKIWEKTFILIPILLFINIFLGEITPFMKIEGEWYWCSNFWFLGFPFYALGYFIHHNEKELKEKLSDKKVLCFIVLSILLNLIERIVTHASQLFISNIIFAFFAFVFCLKYPEYFKQNKLNQMASTIGARYSLGVYFLHPFIRDIYRIFAEKMDISSYKIWMWILPILTFSTSVVLYKIFLSIKEQWGKYRSI